MLIIEVESLCLVTHLTLRTIFIVDKASIIAGLQLNRASYQGAHSRIKHLVKITSSICIVKNFDLIHRRTKSIKFFICWIPLYLISTFLRATSIVSFTWFFVWQLSWAPASFVNPIRRVNYGATFTPFLSIFLHSSCSSCGRCDLVDWFEHCLLRTLNSGAYEIASKINWIAFIVTRYKLSLELLFD